MVQTSTVVALHYDGIRFGCAYFAGDECFILAKNGPRINPDILAKLSHESTNCKVLTSSKSKISLLKTMLWDNPDIELVPAAEFTLFTLPELEEKFQVSIVADEAMCRTSLQALHALLNYMTGIESLRIPKCIQTVELDSDALIISKESLEALQIFHVQSHPNMHIPSGQKEGLSIFKLFQQCHSEEGRRKLRHWFSHPISNMTVLNERLDVVQAVMEPSFQPLVKRILKNLKRIQNTKKIIEELKFNPSPSDLIRICNCIDSAIQIQLQLNDSKQDIQHLTFFDAFLSVDVTELTSLCRLLRRVLDQDHVGEGDIYSIKEQVDAELDSKRQQYNGLSDVLNSVVEEIAAEIKDTIPEAAPLNIVYFPQLGFLITLPQSIQPAGFELQFQSDRTCYYKNDRMRQLDKEIGDVYGEVMDIQLEILQGLVCRIAEFDEDIYALVNYCSDLDCFIAMASTARQYELVRPELTMDYVLQIENGRHLLVELVCPNHFIPNDCNLSDQTMMIVTGANSSGKSIYLKQLGIIAFLAHIGSFVPAKKARIGLIDKILTRIKTSESLANGQSAFAADLKQVKIICESATKKSLILIDEFGKGTCQNDGMALFTGLLDFFGQQQAYPRLIAITHMHEIFKRNLLQSGPLFKYAHMQIFMDQQLCYLYRLEPGMAEQSYAIECAKGAGLAESILSKAKMFKAELEQSTSPQELYLKTNDDEAYQKAIKIIQQLHDCE